MIEEKLTQENLETLKAKDNYESSAAHVYIHKDIHYKHVAHNFSDRTAKSIVYFLARCADIIFKSRYGHRAIVLETVAAVPGMVGGMVQHLIALHLIKDDKGWIKTLLNEAENERMHLMVYSNIFKPTKFERFLIMFVQVCFCVFYFVLYLISKKTAHRVVGYFEEEAIHSYTNFLDLIDSGEIENINAPQVAINYWKLDPDSKLRDVVLATRADEVEHRDVNHSFSDKIAKK